MKYSKQRELILNVVLDSFKHPTAEEVYDIVKKDIPNISLGTVYRNLNQLYEAGLIKKIFMSNGNDRFDKFKIIHNHLYCTKCNQIYDIPTELFNSLSDVLKSNTGHIILEQDTMFIGICKDCQ